MKFKQKLHILEWLFPKNTRRRSILGLFIRILLSPYYYVFNKKAFYEQVVYNLALIQYKNNPTACEAAIKRFMLGDKHRFYVIKCPSLYDSGLFFSVIRQINHVFYAVVKGMIPVIDMKNYQNPYLDEDKVGKENAWQYYFLQPCGYELDDITGLDTTYSFDAYPSIVSWQLQKSTSGKNYDNRFQVGSLIFKHFFKLNEDALKYIEEEYQRLIKPGMRVLGVSLRGTDYFKARGHQIQPKVNDVIAKVREVMVLWNCDYIFLKSEERKTTNMFMEAFPGKVLRSDSVFYDDDLDDDYRLNISVKFNRDNDTYLKGLEYLTAIIILSRCTSAVMGHNSGSMSALYINGGQYENTYIYDLGVV